MDETVVAGIFGLLGVAAGAGATIFGQWWQDERGRAQTWLATKTACEKRLANIEEARTLSGPVDPFPNEVVANEAYLLGEDFDRFLDVQARHGVQDPTLEAQVRGILVRHEFPDRR